MGVDEGYQDAAHLSTLAIHPHASLRVLGRYARLAGENIHKRQKQQSLARPSRPLWLSAASINLSPSRLHLWGAKSGCGADSCGAFSPSNQPPREQRVVYQRYPSRTGAFRVSTPWICLTPGCVLATKSCPSRKSRTAAQWKRLSLVSGTLSSHPCTSRTSQFSQWSSFIFVNLCAAKDLDLRISSTALSAAPGGSAP